MSLVNASLIGLDKKLYYIPINTLAISPSSRQLVFGKAPDFEDGPVPACLIALPEGLSLTTRFLSSVVKTYLRDDDVFFEGFLQHIYVVTEMQPELMKLLGDLTDLTHWGTRSIQIVQIDSENDGSNHGGPYFASSRGLRQAWRLFEDTNGAFIFPVVPIEGINDAYTIPGTSSIPVPSRLYFDQPSSSRPLSGLRIAIKDNIDLKGVCTSVGSRAVQDLYPPKTQNAAYVQKILAAGAVIVGKTKTVQFASGENARDWFDYQAPFNPRADRYQEPGCSSAGSAVAMASYDWLDIAIGTDTLGSIIEPAALQGLYGLRPTLGSSSMEGIFPVSEAFDTVGFFTRSVKLATTAARIFTGPAVAEIPLSKGIEMLYPKDVWADCSPTYQQVVQLFITEMESKFQKRDINMDEMFTTHSGKSLSEFLKTTLAHIQLYDCYHNALPFMQDYKSTFHKKPFADPFIEHKWSLGKELSREQYDTAIKERDEFGAWVRDTLLPQPSDGTALKNFMVVPSNGNTGPSYRHTYNGQTLEESAQPYQGFGFSTKTIAVLAGLPCFTMPIGNFSYMSSVSGREEWLPSSVAVIGPKGSDAILLGLMQDILENSESPHLHHLVTTGITAYPVG